MSGPVKVIYEPSVYVVGGQDRYEPDMSRFLRDQGVPAWDTDTDVAGEALIECAGRLCYESFAKPRPGGNAAYIGHILEVGHGSVLEHEVFNLILTGVSRSFTHELVRHRVGFSYSQLSQRYVDESDVAFVLPPGVPESGVVYDAWLEQVTHARNRYCWLADALGHEFRDIPDKTLRRKRAREAARSVLPNCTETKIFATANARALRHFIELRSDPGADAEIRRVALAVLECMRAQSPNVFGDYAVTPSDEHGFVVSTPHRKV